jgi:hypothetical protein
LGIAAGCASADGTFADHYIMPVKPSGRAIWRRHNESPAHRQHAKRRHLGKETDAGN